MQLDLRAATLASRGSSWARPLNSLPASRVSPPVPNSSRMQADDIAHAFHLCVEFWMPQKATNKRRRFASPNVQPDQAKVRMGPTRAGEISIQTEERWSR